MWCFFIVFLSLINLLFSGSLLAFDDQCVCSSIVFELLQTFGWHSLLSPYYGAWWEGVVHAPKKGELVCLWWAGFCVHCYYWSIVKNDIGIKQFAFVCFKIKKIFIMWLHAIFNMWIYGQIYFLARVHCRGLATGYDYLFLFIAYCKLDGFVLSVIVIIRC